MKTPSFRQLIGVALVGTVSLLSASSVAEQHEPERSPSGYYLTGQTVREESNGVRYAIRHEIAQLPTDRSAAGVRAADISKRATISVVNETSCAALRDAFALGFTRAGVSTADQAARMQLITAACPTGTLRAKSQVILSYKADQKITTLWVEGRAAIVFTGTSAMQDLWGIWFGAQPSTASETALVSRL